MGLLPLCALAGLTYGCCMFLNSYGDEISSVYRICTEVCRRLLDEVQALLA